MVDNSTKTSAHSLRLTADEFDAITARAAACGLAPSAYLRASVLEKLPSARPTLAAASELLAICYALLRESDGHNVPPAEKAVIEQHARRVFKILHEYGQGTGA